MKLYSIIYKHIHGRSMMSRNTKKKYGCLIIGFHVTLIRQFKKFGRNLNLNVAFWWQNLLLDGPGWLSYLLLKSRFDFLDIFECLKSSNYVSKIFWVFLDIINLPWYKWMQISKGFYSIVYNILIHWIVFQYLLWVQGKTFMHFFDTCRQVRIFRRCTYKEIPYLLVLDNFLIILCLFKSMYVKNLDQGVWEKFEYRMDIKEVKRYQLSTICRN